MNRRSGFLIPLLVSLLLPLAILCGVPACGGGGGGSKKKAKAPLGFRVTEIHPVNGELAVLTNAPIKATFSDPVQSTSIDTSMFLVNERATGLKVNGSISFEQADHVVVFTPDSDLLKGTGYRVRILPGVLSIAGDTLTTEFDSLFTTGLGNGSPTPPPPPVTGGGTITPVGSMNVGRSSHTATLMNDGRVLIAGGFDTASSLTASAEIYDPATRKFTLTGSLSTARAYHTATLLQNGQVLITGGVAGASFTETNSVEIYDPATSRFFTPPNGMHYARAFHTATLLKDGRVLITGGTVPGSGGSFSSKTAEVYDPQTTIFTKLPDMAVYRAGQTATRLPDGRVLIVGGNSTDKRVEIFDPTTNTFTTMQGQLHTARRGHTATLLPDGNVLIMGGGERSAEIYDPSKDYFQWTGGYPLYDRTDHTASLTKNGLVLFVGGSRTVNGSLFFNATTELYQPSTETFIGAPVVPYPMTRQRATTLDNGDILITGGSNVDPTQPNLAAAELYQSANN